MRRVDKLNKQWLTEETTIQKAARYMGLEDYKFGRYGNNGVVTFEVVNGVLKPVSKKAEPEPEPKKRSEHNGPVETKPLEDLTAEEAIDFLTKKEPYNVDLSKFSDRSLTIWSGNVVGEWSDSSATPFPSLIRYLAMRVFNIANWHPLDLNELKDTIEDDLKEMKLREHYPQTFEELAAGIKALYNETQEGFKKDGITEVKVYRGIQGIKAGDTVKHRALNSFTTKKNLATTFASAYKDTGRVLEQTMPVENFLFAPVSETYHTKHAWNQEEEYLAIDGESKLGNESQEKEKS